MKRTGASKCNLDVLKEDAGIIVGECSTPIKKE